MLRADATALPVSWAARLLTISRWSVLLSLFAIPINKPATSIFLFFGLLFALLAPDLAARAKAALRQPVVQGCAAVFFLLFLSALHAPAGSNRWEELGSMRALLYPFLIALSLTTNEWRTRGLFAFSASAILVLFLSFGQLAGIVPERDITGVFDAYRYTVFENYSQQGMQFLMMASLCAAWASMLKPSRGRMALWVIAALALANVVFMLQSRTSYLVVAPLLLFWGWRILSVRFGALKSLLIGAVLLAVLGAAASLTPRVQTRMDAAEQDITQYLDKRQATSLGIRLELWKRSLPIIASAPWFGHGLGQWESEYRAQTKDLQDFESFRMGHPHQEALYFMAEEGIIGFAVILLLLVLLARHVRRLPLPQRDFYISLLIIYISAGLANCLLVDFVHRHAFIMLLACIPLLAGEKTGRGES